MINFKNGCIKINMHFDILSLKIDLIHVIIYENLEVCMLFRNLSCTWNSRKSALVVQVA